MYFVKKPAEKENGEMVVSIDGIRARAAFGKLEVVYRGTDEEEAKNVAESLDVAVLSEFAHDRGDGHVSSVSHAKYRAGKCWSAQSQGLDRVDPATGILRSHRSRNHGSVEFSKVYELFTSQEMDYLAAHKKVA